MKGRCGKRLIEMESGKGCGFVYFGMVYYGCIEGNVMMLIVGGFF